MNVFLPLIWQIIGSVDFNFDIFSSCFLVFLNAIVQDTLNYVLILPPTLKIDILLQQLEQCLCKK